MEDPQGSTDENLCRRSLAAPRAVGTPFFDNHSDQDAPRTLKVKAMQNPKIATFNIYGIGARLQTVCSGLRKSAQTLYGYRSWRLTTKLSQQTISNDSLVSWIQGSQSFKK